MPPKLGLLFVHTVSTVQRLWIIGILYSFWNPKALRSILMPWKLGILYVSDTVKEIAFHEHLSFQVCLRAFILVHCLHRQNSWNIVLVLSSASFMQHPYALKARNIVHSLHRLNIWNILLVLSSASLMQHPYALKARNFVHGLHRQIYNILYSS